MIKVHILGPAIADVRTLQASVPVVTDLIAGHPLRAVEWPLPTGAASGGPARGPVLIELPPGVEVPGAAAPGVYRVEGLGAHEAEQEILAAPGESGG